MPRTPRKPAPRKARAAKATVVRRQDIESEPHRIPPSNGAPPQRWPIAVEPLDRALAPVPINDRFPLITGQQLNLQYLASTFRLAITGYRQQYVDLLDELIEHDPHLFAVVQKRILSVANGRLEVFAAELDPDDDEADAAEELANFVRDQLRRVPDLAQSLAALLWGGYYGISAAENHWTRDSDGWHFERFGFVHTRRLAYPDYQSWDLYVWDQGQVYGWQAPWGLAPTNSGTFGLRVADYPGKFTVYAPQQRGDYPTRDGYGRECAVFCILKRIAGRGGSAYLERWAKPIMDLAWSTQADGKPREATTEDVALAIGAQDQIGVGSASGWAHPDSVKLQPVVADNGKAKLTWKEWIDICNSEMSKAVLGGTINTDHRGGGGLGGKGIGDTQERAEVDLEQYDATTLAQTLERDVVRWIVRLNRPDQMHLCPRIVINVDKEPDPRSIAELAKTLTQIGCPVDADNLAEDVGIQLVPGDKDADGRAIPRRTFWSDVADPMAIDPDLMSEEAKQQKEADRKAKSDALTARAQMKPGAVPNGAAKTNGATKQPS